MPRPGGTLSQLDSQALLTFDNLTKVGSYNDPDMLTICNGGQSDAEYRAQLSLWSILTAPLILGNDVRNLSDSCAAIILNKDVVSDTVSSYSFKITMRLMGLHNCVVSFATADCGQSRCQCREREAGFPVAGCALATDQCLNPARSPNNSAVCTPPNVCLWRTDRFCTGILHCFES